MSIQQMLLGVGAVDTKTYVEDIFSSYLRNSTGANAAVNNGIDLAGQGGLVWFKSRSHSYAHALIDTERGTTKWLQSNSNALEGTATSTSPVANAQMMESFNSNGYTVGPDAWNGPTNYNDPTQELVDWTFRKAPGFCDVVTFSPSSYSSNQRISHSLGCIPGLILLKSTTENENWYVYHRSLGEDKYLSLNGNGDATTSTSAWGPDGPTATDFGFNTNGLSSAMPITYVAYLFAGGESTAATARSVDFDAGPYLSIPGSSSSSLRPGTGDFCIEAWLKPDSFSNERGHYMTDNGGILFQSDGTNYIFKKHGGSALLTGPGLEIGQWTHVAVTRSGTSLKMFYNGTQVASATDSTNITGTATTYIGSTIDYWDGKISNLRLVIGSAVYTSSFKPPTEPLTNITNTVLLCCNDSSTTGSTVTPGTITASGSPTASTDSPFDDPAGFVFGDAGDQNVIKCGSYVGNGSPTGPEINLGWQAQYILLKNADEEEQWQIFDSMRGIVTDGNDAKLLPSNDGGESSNSDVLDLTPTGFKLKTSATDYNGNDDQIIYIAIRRPDGYVGKPPELGTDVFAMDVGNSNGSPVLPVFDSNFPVDFALRRQPGSTDDWDATARLFQGKRVKTNSPGAQSDHTSSVFDSNVGWSNGDFNSNYQSWMWKRHAGFDVVTYVGDGVADRHLPHSMSKAPEMVWIKLIDRDNHSWVVGHKGLDKGTNPWHKYLWLNTNDGETDGTWPWNDTAPTANHLVLGNGGTSNGDTDPYIAMLFASVPGISKVGSYAGNGTSSSSTQTITTGFQPRFIIIKAYSNDDGTATDENWSVFDSVRGWSTSSGTSDKLLRLNTDAAQLNFTMGYPTSTGFVLEEDKGAINRDGRNYIYYAHA